MIEEEWRTVKDFENYKVSNFGRIKNINFRNTGRDYILKPNLNRGGYLKLSLSKDGKRTTKKVHQLVAIAFLNHTPCGFELVVNHKNFIRHDNRLENLEIISQLENIRYRNPTKKSQFSGDVGVYWHKVDKKWYSSIIVNGKYMYLGCFSDKDEASKYYQNALLSIKNGSDIEVKVPKYSSKYKGVYWHKRNRKWQSSITINGKNKHLGLFDNEEDAYITCQNALNIINMKNDIIAFGGTEV